jgi:thiamine monophosphate synthase
VNSNKLLKKEVQKFVKGHRNENKGKKASPTCEGAPNLVECTLKSSCKALEIRMFKSFHHLKFLEAQKCVTLHQQFKAKLLVSQHIQVHTKLFKLDHKNTHTHVHFLHFALYILMLLKQL